MEAATRRRCGRLRTLWTRRSSLRIGGLINLQVARTALTNVRALAFLVPRFIELTAATIDIKGLLV